MIYVGGATSGKEENKKEKEEEEGKVSGVLAYYNAVAGGSQPG